MHEPEGGEERRDVTTHRRNDIHANLIQDEWQQKNVRQSQYTLACETETAEKHHYWKFVAINERLYLYSFAFTTKSPLLEMKASSISRIMMKVEE
jgi:hypothetical protein